MCEKIKQIAKDTGGSAIPLTIALVLSFVILMCGVSEYFRLQIIASGVKEAVEDAIISTVNDNYAGVYHGVREGYSGGYMPDSAEDWEEALNTGDIYAYLDRTIGTKSSGGRRVKYARDDDSAMEFAIDSLNVTHLPTHATHKDLKQMPLFVWKCLFVSAENCSHLCSLT